MSTLRLIPLNTLKIGDVLDKPLYTGDGRVLLARGMVLTGTYISKLDQLGVQALYIQDSRTEDIEIQETLSERVRFEAMSRVRELGDAIRIQKNRPNDKTIADSRPLKRTASDIVEEVLRSDITVHNLVEMRGRDGWLVPHSVQVALISVIIGQAMELDRQKLTELAMGALLHDIGMTLLPTELLQKSPLAYTDEERKLYESHCQLGFDFLRKKTDFPLLVAHVAFQHHENLSGNGFPRKLSSEDIHFYAKVVHVADTYDELITGAPGRPTLPPHEVYEIIMGLVNKSMDYRIVETFTRHVAAYPTGYTVRLSNGEMGIVCRQNALATRPVVRVLWDRPDRLEAVEYDLCQNLTLFIKDVIT